MKKDEEFMRREVSAQKSPNCRLSLDIKYDKIRKYKKTGTSCLTE